MKIVFASKNPHKFAEVEAVLSASPQVEELLALSAFGNPPEVEESGTTFAANAERKSAVYSIWLERNGCQGCWALAEDAGLEVAALNGFPGVLSSRLAPTDPERMAVVLDRLEAASSGKPWALPDWEIWDEPAWPSVPANRSRVARFVSAMALAAGGRVVAHSVGTVGGFITEKPRGKGGFGYDPIFYYPPFGRTFGECSPEEKRAVSHRGRALAAMLAEIDHLAKRQRRKQYG